MPGFSISTLLVRLLVLVIGIPIHEWAHAWSAYKLGDATAESEGRMTLNPLAHLDPVGSLLILVSGFGWGKPVPVNPYRMRVSPRVGMAITSAAGPLSNFFLAMLLAIPLRMRWIAHYSEIGELLTLAIQINLGLMLFNLLPAYPLDGEKVLVGVLPPRWGDHLLHWRPYSMLILAALLFILPRVGLDLLSLLIAPAYMVLMSLLLYL
jgi:Zn-dependent protease